MFDTMTTISSECATCGRPTDGDAHFHMDADIDAVMDWLAKMDYPTVKR